MVAMPSVSKAQAKTMRAAAHNPKFAKKVGIPAKVAKEYAHADKLRDIAKLPRRAKNK